MRIWKIVWCCSQVLWVRPELKKIFLPFSVSFFTVHPHRLAPWHACRIFFRLFVQPLGSESWWIRLTETWPQSSGFAEYIERRSHLTKRLFGRLNRAFPPFLRGEHLSPFVTNWCEHAYFKLASSYHNLLIRVKNHECGPIRAWTDFGE